MVYLYREKSEDRRLETENTIETQLAQINELKRKVDELTVKADEAEALRDELEEYRHELERMDKLESLLEKYKRKVEDTTDLKRQIKVIKYIILL